jgi:hypothetical protein
LHISFVTEHRREASRLPDSHLPVQQADYVARSNQFERNSEPNWLFVPFQVYFPAVTICTGLTTDYNWEIEHQLGIEKGTLKLEDLNETLLSLVHVHNLVTRNGFLVKSNLSLNTGDFKKKLEETFIDGLGSISFSQYILFEMYRPEFLRVLTYWGICSTFNMAGFNRIFADNR